MTLSLSLSSLSLDQLPDVLPPLPPGSVPRRVTESRLRGAAHLGAFNDSRRLRPEEDAAIIKRLPKVGMRQIAAELGRSYGGVQARVQQLVETGAVPDGFVAACAAAREEAARDVAQQRRESRAKQAKRAAGRAWTNQENAYLMQWWGVLPDERVARRLNRTVRACAWHAPSIHLNKCDNRELTCAGVARLVGTSVLNPPRWIRRGHLLGWQVGSPKQRNRIWSIKEEHVEAFLKEKTWLYDWRTVEAGYWREIAQEASERDEWLTLAEAAARIGYSPGWLATWLTRAGVRTEQRPTKGSLRGTRVVRWQDVRAAHEAHDSRAFENRSVARRAVWARGMVTGWNRVTPPTAAPFKAGDSVRCVSRPTGKQYHRCLGRVGVVRRLLWGYARRAPGETRPRRIWRVTVEFPSIAGWGLPTTSAQIEASALKKVPKTRKAPSGA